MLIQTTIWWVPLVSIYTAMFNCLNAAFREAAETRVGFAAMIVSMLVTVVLVATWQLRGAAIALLAKGFINIAFRVPLFLSAMRSSAPATHKPSTVSTGDAA